MRKFAKYAKIKTDKITEHHLDGNAIVIEKCENYGNHIEMSGLDCSLIVSYGADKKGNLRMMYHAVFPNMRVLPNNTGGSLSYNFSPLKLCKHEKVRKFRFDGVLEINSFFEGLDIKRKIFPSASGKAFIEKLVLTNNEQNSISISIKKTKDCIIPYRKTAINEEYIMSVNIFDCNGEKLDDVIEIQSNKCVTFYAVYTAEVESDISGDSILPYTQENKRRELIDGLDKITIIDTPDKIINIMAKYAKLRDSESIFNTKRGLMHSPGGGNYYAAIWTNDQCEYAAPYFAYQGYDLAFQAALNCFRLYKPYISVDKALITSIIAEGDDYWNGAGDRGDSAMYAYGAARFAMSSGDKGIAEELLPYIESCLTYTLSRINSNGVVASDSDELENRFLSGKANLSTSCIAYDALISAMYLEYDLGAVTKGKYYEKKASELKDSIINYFGARVEGFDTFRYCEEETRLRSWICLPQTVGINYNFKGTVEALLSEKLFKNGGLLTRSGSKTFWDRSTLYSLRALFIGGYADEAVDLLTSYSATRLLGNHIPYAVEAYPEGNQAHLSAESSLYLRVFVEGILGYRPVGLRKFILKPHLPKKWGYININNIKLHGKFLNVSVIRNGSSYDIELGDKLFKCYDEITIDID